MTEPLDSRPPLAVYVVWHPEAQGSAEFARAIFRECCADPDMPDHANPDPQLQSNSPSRHHMSWQLSDGPQSSQRYNGGKSLLRRNLSGPDWCDDVQPLFWQRIAALYR